MDVQFEELYLSLGGKQSELEKEDGEYTHSKSQMAWEIWQAKASVAEGFVLVELNDLTTVLSNCSDAMMDESTSSVYDETGEPSTWFDHHVAAEGNLLLAIGKAQEQSNG